MQQESCSRSRFVSSIDTRSRFDKIQIMKKAPQLRLGLAQINPTVGDLRGNSEKIIHYAKEAEKRGLDLVVFPELSICGYPVWDLANKKSFVDASRGAIQAICRATRSFNVRIIAGFISYGKKATGRTRNSLCLIHKGKVVFVQEKSLLPTYDVFLEQIFFEPGEKHHVFSLKGFKLGTTICEDIWDDAYPVKPAKILKERGMNILINISASPYHRRVAFIREQLIRRKAKENRVWLVYVNQVGAQDDLVFDGRSLVADPSGRLMACGKPFVEEMLEVAISSQPGDHSIKSSGPVHETAEMYEALVLGIRDYAQKNGFKKVVVGLSGGIDSALVVTLATDALGPKSVIGVTMPGKYSSEGSYRDSEALAKNLGIELRNQSINGLYEKFLSQVADRKRSRSQEVKEISLANENLQARLRALELMYISNDENCLLLSTGNKSELAMGYCTLYGDMCGGLAVLGDVCKTDVYRIAEYRNSLSHCIPQAILDKAPSAELRPNQKDQDSLPPYEQLDQILTLHIEKNMPEKKMIRLLAPKGIPRDVILDVIKRVEHNEYKRRQTPPIIRVTEKAWFGRRMPITNRFFK